jgi:hypothetical protein
MTKRGGQMKNALVTTLLLLLGSTILGATVLREPLARAAVPIASVFVTNDPSSPVPVREQNLDANGNEKVHEQGTANVRVVDSSLLTTAPQGARQTFDSAPVAAVGSDLSLVFPAGPINASLITLTSMRGAGYVLLSNESGSNRLLFDTDGGNVVLPLVQPLTIDRILVSCPQGSPVPCAAQLNVVGR